MEMIFEGDNRKRGAYVLHHLGTMDSKAKIESDGSFGKVADFDAKKWMSYFANSTNLA